MRTEHYETLTEAADSLRAKGFNLDFSATPRGVQCQQLSRTYNPEELRIRETHRFEGITDPADEAVLYALESADGTAKGLLVDAFGIYAESDTAETISRIARDVEAGSNAMR